MQINKLTCCKSISSVMLYYMIQFMFYIHMKLDTNILSIISFIRHY